VDLTEQPGENIFGLLVASDELLLEELFNHVQDYLIEKQSTWIENNFVLVLHIVFKLSSCKKLQDYCLESIFSDLQPFNTSKEFPSLDKDVLYDLLKRDDLNIEEIIAWDYLIKWGIEQTPGLGIKKRDRTKWNNKNYEALKKTLNEFIPLIRFTAISSADFFDKVRPYKAVIPCHIYEEVMEFYMKNTSPKTTTLPPRVGNIRIDSKLIKSKLTSIIAGWIERKNDNNPSLNKKYKFDLLYRSSRDGMSISSLHSNCDGQGPCLILVKNQPSSKIYGGYNPLGLANSNGGYNPLGLANSNGLLYNPLGLPNSNVRYNPLGLANSNVGYNPIGLANSNERYDYTTESFIFSFENNEDIRNMKIGRVNSIYASYAIYQSSNYGFNFGGETFAMNSNQSVCFNNSGYYDNFINVLSPYTDYNLSFTPEEIEVFKITVS
jgi:hypothetical protein